MMLIFLFAFTYHTYSIDSSKTFAQDDNVDQTFCVNSKVEMITPLLPMQSKLY